MWLPLFFLFLKKKLKTYIIYYDSIKLTMLWCQAPLQYSYEIRGFRKNYVRVPDTTKVGGKVWK